MKAQSMLVAAPIFTIEQIAEWLESSHNIFDLNNCKEELIEMLNDPTDGIEAVTKRKESK